MDSGGGDYDRSHGTSLRIFQTLADAVGREAMEKAFRPDPVFKHVPGVQQIEKNLAIASLLQHLREQRPTEPTEPNEDAKE